MTAFEIADKERRRISGELHDRVGPTLAAAGLNLHVIQERLLAGGDPELLQLIAESQALLSQAVTGIREMLDELRPARLEYAGLEAALADFERQYRRRTGIATRFEIALWTSGEIPGRLDSASEVLLFRVIQEALANCARHAKARHVDVELRCNLGIIELRIKDDGVGFIPEAIAAGENPPGLGLLEMRERTEAAGGSFSLSSSPGRGTQIFITLPCVRAHEALSAPQTP